MGLIHHDYDDNVFVVFRRVSLWACVSRACLSCFRVTSVYQYYRVVFENCIKHFVHTPFCLILHFCLIPPFFLRSLFLLSFFLFSLSFLFSSLYLLQVVWLVFVLFVSNAFALNWLIAFICDVLSLSRRL